MENLDFVYLQLSQEVHNDRPRIMLQTSDGNSRTLYISDLESQGIDIKAAHGHTSQTFLNQINTYLKNNSQNVI